MDKVEFPLTDDELSRFCEYLNSLDFSYFEECINASYIREEDIPRIAVVKHCLEQFNDVIANRISSYENRGGLKLPTGDALDAILDEYYH